MSEERRTLLERLEQEVTVPEIVRKKADMAFETIRSGQAERGGSRYRNERENSPRHSGAKRRKTGRRILIAAAAAVLATGVVSVGAATYLRWSGGFSERLQISEEQQKVLETTGMAVSYEDQTVTDQGITVSLKQSIVDNYFAYLVFEVEGYQVEPNVQPAFEHLTVSLDGEDSVEGKGGIQSYTADGNFYNGLIFGPEGIRVNADGSPREQDENGNEITNYMMDDQTLEYWLILDARGNKGYFLDKPLHVELENIGTVAEADYFPDREGDWSFDFTLTGSDEMRTLDLEAPIGDTGMTMTHVELSPVSAYIEYLCPEQNGFDLVGDVFPGIKMKDGTLYPSLWLEPSVRGAVSEGSDTWRYSFSFDRILDPDQIEAVIFRKPDHRSEVLTEDDFYVVPLETQETEAETLS